MKIKLLRNHKKYDRIKLKCWLINTLMALFYKIAKHRVNNNVSCCVDIYSGQASMCGKSLMTEVFRYKSVWTAGRREERSSSESHLECYMDANYLTELRINESCLQADLESINK